MLMLAMLQIESNQIQEAMLMRPVLQLLRLSCRHRLVAIGAHASWEHLIYRAMSDCRRKGERVNMLMRPCS